MLTEQVYQSKYGYYPCDYETFRKLKLLHKLYYEAMKKRAAWERWSRKEPQNRVIRRKIRNAARQPIGYQAPVPMPEPPLCPVFNEKYEAQSWWNKGGKYHKNKITLEYARLINHEIMDEYANARYPKDSPDHVRPLKWSLEQIDELYQRAIGG